MAGEVIAGRYLLCDPIGVGGTGVVWRAFDRERDRFCAAKLLRQRDAGQLLRFAREQSVRIPHPHIVSPYAWAADDGMVLIASELVDGGSLHTLLGDYGPLSDATVVDVLDQVLDALGAVHAAQLIHRDVKPGNLLLRAGADGPLHVLLTDFGLTIGVRDARLTEVGSVIGTPGYLPPEVLGGGVSPDVRHDLYAVGRLALTMHAGVEVADMDHWVADIDDPVLRGAVRAMVSPNPDDRPADTSAARALLAPAARDGRARTRDGEAVTVLNQLPPLPDGWSPADAGRAADATGGPDTRVDAPVTDILTTDAAPEDQHRIEHLDVRQAPAGPILEPVAEKHVTEKSVTGNPVTETPVRADVRGAAPVPERAVVDHAAGGRGVGTGSRAAGPATRSEPGVGRRTRGRAVTASWVGGIAAVAVVGVVLTRLGSADPGGEAPPPTSGESSVSGQPSVSAGPVVSGTVAIDTACGWQQEGDRGNTAEGTVLTCAIVDGGYRWTAGG